MNHKILLKPWHFILIFATSLLIVVFGFSLCFLWNSEFALSDNITVIIITLIISGSVLGAISLLTFAIVANIMVKVILSENTDKVKIALEYFQLEHMKTIQDKEHEIRKEKNKFENYANLLSRSKMEEKTETSESTENRRAESQKTNTTTQFKSYLDEKLANKIIELINHSDSNLSP